MWWRHHSCETSHISTFRSLLCYLMSLCHQDQDGPRSSPEREVLSLNIEFMTLSPKKRIFRTHGGRDQGSLLVKHSKKKKKKKKKRAVHTQT
jgi:hypothetical protein